MTYISTKTYGHEIGLSACFRQWRATSHCRFLHGYALSVRLEFEAEVLDQFNWVVDFGGLKQIKAWLETTFDHKLVVAADDPWIADFKLLDELRLAEVVEVPATGCEAFSKLIYDHVANWLQHNTYADYTPRVWLRSVTVAEHGANSAVYTQERQP